METEKPKREWKARFKVQPFLEDVDQQTIAALEHICPEKRVVLHYSTGKDSIAAWIALRDAGFEVVPVYKEVFPNISFIDSVIAAHEEYFGTEVIKVPYKGLFQSLHNAYGSRNDHANLELIDIKSKLNREYSMKEDFNDYVLNYTQCGVSVIGVKASDSIHRRTNFLMSGPYNAKQRMFSINWRLAKNAPLRMIMNANCPLPKYYLWLNRSPEFLFPSEFYFIKKYYPQDWEKICSYLPDAEVRVKAYEFSDNPRILLIQKQMKEAYESGYKFV